MKAAAVTIMSPRTISMNRATGFTKAGLVRRDDVVHPPEEAQQVARDDKVGDGNQDATPITRVATMTIRASI